MRLFTAIDFPGEIRNRIDELVPDLPGWRKTKKEQLHLTLLFLGDCTAQQKTIIEKRLTEIIFPEFEMVIQGPGVFPHPKNPRILWFGFTEDEILMKLQADMSEKLSELVKKPDQRNYLPHCTVARRKSGSGRDENINEVINKEYPAMAFTAGRFVLKQSTLKPGGSEHVVLKEYPATF